MATQLVMPLPALHLNHDADYDWLIATEFGTVFDEVPEELVRRVGERFLYFMRRPRGRVVGFTVGDFSQFDAEAREHEAIWSGSRFDCPVLGLRKATAGEIVLAARAFFGDDSTINRHYFDMAVAEKDPEVALPLWRWCLEAGDLMAHYGLGYTLLELDRHHEAYRHLRAYTEINPHCAWAWRYRGAAAEGLAEWAEARRAYRRALALERKGADETDAAELLEALEEQHGLGAA